MGSSYDSSDYEEIEVTDSNDSDIEYRSINKDFKKKGKKIIKVKKTKYKDESDDEKKDKKKKKKKKKKKEKEKEKKK